MAQILYVTGQSVTLYRTRHKGIEKRGQYPCNDTGYAALCRTMRDDDPHPVSILVDLIEEEFREESLPHIVGRDRVTLHARHASKLFRSTPFRHHRVINRQREGRRDDQVLFSALTNRDNIEPLLAALEATAVPVKGIHSLPIITRHLIKTLGVQAGNVLIVTEQPDGGMRETFVRNGHVHFSRLAPISDNSPADYCHILTAEAQKTRRYLQTLRLLPHDQPLEVHALCDKQRMDCVRSLPDQSDGIHIQAASLAHVAQRLGLPGHPDSHISDALFCYLLHKHPVRNHYAPRQHLRNWYTHQARLGLRAATWLIAVGAITLSGMNVVDSLLAERESQHVAQVGLQVNNDYHRIREHLPVTPDTALAMREAIEVADRLQAYPVNLDQLFRLVGSGFTAQPDLAIDKFNWFVASNRGATSLSRDRQGDEQQTAQELPYLIGTISGHVRNFKGNYSAAQQQITRMTDWLSGQPGVLGAELVRKPLNTRTDNNLQGAMAMKGDRETADFELRIVLELQHEPV